MVLLRVYGRYGGVLPVEESVIDASATGQRGFRVRKVDELLDVDLLKVI